VLVALFQVGRVVAIDISRDDRQATRERRREGQEIPKRTGDIFAIQAVQNLNSGLTAFAKADNHIRIAITIHIACGEVHATGEGRTGDGFFKAQLASLGVERPDDRGHAHIGTLKINGCRHGPGGDFARFELLTTGSKPRSDVRLSGSGISGKEAACDPIHDLTSNAKVSRVRVVVTRTLEQVSNGLSNT
jgi:hypothetical protein